MKKQPHIAYLTNEHQRNFRFITRLHRAIWREMSNLLAVVWALCSHEELEIVYENLRVWKIPALGWNISYFFFKLDIAHEH